MIVRLVIANMIDVSSQLVECGEQVAAAAQAIKRRNRRQVIERFIEWAERSVARTGIARLLVIVLGVLRLSGQADIARNVSLCVMWRKSTDKRTEGRAFAGAAR